MYARFHLDPHTPDATLQIGWCRIPTETAAALTPAEAQRRMGLVSAVVQGTLPQAGVAEQVRLAKLILPVARLAPHDPVELDFAIHLALAHQRLDTASRVAREQRIEHIIQRHHPSLNDAPAALGERLARLRTVAPLAPDGLLTRFVESELTGCARELLQPEIQARLTTPYTTQVATVTVLLKNACPASYREIGGIFYSMLATAIDRETVVTMLRLLCELRLGTAIERAVRAVQQPLAGLDIAARIAHLLEMMRQLLAEQKRPPADRCPPEELVDAEAGRMKAWLDQAFADLALQTLQAMKAGVPLGQAGALNQDVMERLRQTRQAIDHRMTPRRLREALLQRRQRAAARAGATRNDAPPGDDPVHAWSVNRLLEWIEGPLATRPGTSAGPIDRAALARRTPGAQPAPATARPSAGAALRPPEPEPAFDAADVDLMLRDALEASARFFLADIAELLPRAATCGAPAGLLEACERLQAPLQQLAGHDMPDEPARALLGEAEAAINALRAGIRAAEGEAHKRQRFEARLTAALAAETLALGKAHGGVIDVRLDPDDWAWVAETYHRRWLARLRPVAIDGTPCALPPDQALALYVTGSSLSGHAFDISVHLWRRRPGSQAAPATAEGLYPPMNDTDWYDTYQPCAVLHVPR